MLSFPRSRLCLALELCADCNGMPGAASLVPPICYRDLARSGRGLQGKAFGGFAELVELKLVATAFECHGPDRVWWA